MFSKFFFSDIIWRFSVINVSKELFKKMEILKLNRDSKLVHEIFKVILYPSVVILLIICNVNKQS